MAMATKLTIKSSLNIFDTFYIIHSDAKTFSVMTLNIMTFSVSTLSLITFSIVAHST